jgi:hypothetical protein
MGPEAHRSVPHPDYRVQRYEMLREHRPGAVPHARGVAEAHDEQEGLAFALFIPIESRSLIVNEWHPCLLSGPVSLVCQQPPCNLASKFDGIHRVVTRVSEQMGKILLQFAALPARTQHGS